MAVPFKIDYQTIEIPITQHLENLSNNKATSEASFLPSLKATIEGKSNFLVLSGDLNIPMDASAIIIFAHGSGSGRESERNQQIANILNNAGQATLLVDLLTQKERNVANKSRGVEFDIRLLARRLKCITQWVVSYPVTQNLKIGYLGSSTGAAAALITASEVDNVSAIVCRGGRTDLATTENVLENIEVPVLFVVGGNDYPIIEMNKEAYTRLKRTQEKEIIIIPHASHLFEEPNKIEEVAIVARNWFERHSVRCTDRGATTATARRSNSSTPIRYRQQHKIMGGKMSITSRFLSALRGDVLFRMKFKDRKSAAEVLAAVVKTKLKQVADIDDDQERSITVIGIPRAGAVIADRVATKLSCDFDLIILRRLLAPYSLNAFGAIVSDGTFYIDEAAVNFLNIPETYLEKEKMQQIKEINRRVSLYRPHNKEYAVRNRIVVLIDDGAATGASLIAAARMIRKQQPKFLMIAIPVAKPDIVGKLEQEADMVEAIITPSTFAFVSQFYQNYDSVLDTQIMEIMRRRGILL
jgi:predicted phosphoribosyltransferase/dienelactone hydrolase